MWYSRALSRTYAYTLFITPGKVYTQGTPFHGARIQRQF